MTWGLKRFQQADSLHFITFSCYHRYPYLSDSQSKSVVEAILEQTRARHNARIYAYVLMPEHVHLLINEPPHILLSQFLKALKQMTSRRLKGVAGPLTVFLRSLELLRAPFIASLSHAMSGSTAQTSHAVRFPHGASAAKPLDERLLCSSHRA